MKIRVYYEDTDTGGIVYHTNYIKFCERARSELFFQRDMLPSQSEHSGFVVHTINAKFLATSKLGDILDVTTKVLKVKKTSLTLLQEVWKDSLKVFSMEVTLVYVDKGKPSRIPIEFSDIFASH